ncbi:T9SS type A sorting domain-containing protein [Hymenobacter gummosus]|uniref:T9SS type A sorting domain-containing protein n=1 Tax=Hymenobacter gummosus TaxID=1776032 RepID=A0A431U0R4_9BACT|nr:CotH kinase family protein [Hymenobacter gummosus]RTQ48513.1 T9SS type A sorting domain-containing protein [Hymenobacter gummosus]
MKNTITLRLQLLALLVLLPALGARAGDTLRVAAPLYHRDAAHRLILVNQSLAALNAGSTENRQFLALDQVYEFVQPVRTFRTDSAYHVAAGGTTYQLYFTALPIIHLDTRHQIADTPSVYARFALVQPSGATVRANAGVEYRGASSQAYPKKSFELSFWDDTTGAASRDVALLGMRTDNKYNLQAMYNEPLRLRSKVANALWLEIHQIYYQAQEPEAKNGIAAEYVEVFVNDEYRGVYALSERVDRKQLKLKKYANNTITGELYKGADWVGGATTFSAVPPFDNRFDTWGGFEYKHPEERIDWTYLSNFCSFVVSSSDADFYSSYKQKFHLGNAVDYYLFLNLTRALDNTGKNLYIAKYKQGEPYYYVPWDLDGVFGTDWSGGYTGSVNDILSNGFYDRLERDCSPGGFRETLRTRWAALRATVLTEAHIMAKFRANYDYLQGNNVYAREQLVWSAFRADSADLASTAAWVRQRLGYLDGEFGQACITAAVRQTPGLLKLYPNPATEVLRVECTAPAYELSIRDLNGRVVLQTALKGPQNQVNIGALRAGLYVVTVQTPTATATQKLVVE